MITNQRASFQKSAPVTYLLTWNPGKYQWHTFQDEWEAVNLGHRIEGNWSCGNSKKHRVGDRVFMMRLGATATKGIIASGWVTAEAFEDIHWDETNPSGARYIGFYFDSLLNPDLQPLLDPAKVSTNYNWTPQTSGLTIYPDVAARLEKLWGAHLEDLGTKPNDAVSKFESEADTKTYLEGKKTQFLINRYERDPRARSSCIEQRGTLCKICGFNFEHEFGAIGEGFIHVHHTIPLSEQGKEYVIDPRRDLVPVCPNCHAMLHRKSPPYTIEELQQIRRQMRQI